MVKLVIILAPGVALALVYFLAARLVCRAGLDRAVELFIKLAGIALIGVVMLLAIGRSFSGYETIADALQQFVHWLSS